MAIFNDNFFSLRIYYTFILQQNTVFCIIFKDYFLTFLHLKNQNPYIHFNIMNLKRFMFHLRKISVISSIMCKIFFPSIYYIFIFYVTSLETFLEVLSTAFHSLCSFGDKRFCKSLLSVLRD